jgi:hypothetical protein
MEYFCPVCAQAFDTPWEGSFDICPGCGIQFGYDESGRDTNPIVYEEWRKAWIANGEKPLDSDQEATVHGRIRTRLSS